MEDLLKFAGYAYCVIACVVLIVWMACALIHELSGSRHKKI